jgi:predicted metal-dependent hydrolase
MSVKILLDSGLESWREALTATVPDIALHTLQADINPAMQVADMQPNLILINTEQLPSWTADIRSNPATRRIPVLGIGLDATKARGHGVIDFLTPEEFRATLPQAIMGHARFYTQVDALQDACAGTLPPLVIEGLREFNAGEYFEAHETLEHAWNDEPGPVREVYRAVLQIAVAYLQITRGNYRGALKMFLRSRQWFAPLPDVCQGIEIRQLKADAALVRAHLEDLGAERMTEFDRTLLRPVVFRE